MFSSYRIEKVTKTKGNAYVTGEKYWYNTETVVVY